jgi:hypothetical protein
VSIQALISLYRGRGKGQGLLGERVDDEDFWKDAVVGSNVGECDVPACSYSPCYDHGTCQT